MQLQHFTRDLQRTTAIVEHCVLTEASLSLTKYRNVACEAYTGHPKVGHISDHRYYIAMNAVEKEDMTLTTQMILSSPAHGDIWTCGSRPQGTTADPGHLGDFVLDAPNLRPYDLVSQSEAPYQKTR